MQLYQLARAVGIELDRSQSVEVSGLTERTDAVVGGRLFACVAGSRRDGHDHAGEAVAAGAVALLVERKVDVDVPQLLVPDVRAALAPIAATFYGRPADKLRLVGITGTNGKTTTTHILSHILRRAGLSTATVGTLSGQYTTPPAIELQALLHDYSDQGIEAVVMEVSSGGLVQGRVDEIVFEVAVFTNLTQDHLDYHKTMHAYFEAKAMLFTSRRARFAVINAGDSYGQQIMQRTEVPVRAFAVESTEGVHVGPDGSEFVFEGLAVSLPLVGRFNVENALAAADAAIVMGIPAGVIVDALSDVPPVPGRLETVDRGQPFTVMVDFAHTPDGLEGVLNVAAASAQAAEGKVIVVFGCGGDRDREKRPQMGMVAEQLADVVIVTNDNSRSEDPAAIAAAVLDGMQAPDKATVELDRSVAISLAIQVARPNDVVVIAGKGHETTQEVGEIKSPFDDRVVAGEAIERRAGRW